MSATQFRHLVLLALVLFAVSSLYGCAACGDVDGARMSADLQALQSPEMQRRIAEALR